MKREFTTWHADLTDKLNELCLMSPTQLARAVVANGGRVSRQVAWRWINGQGVACAGNILPICQALGLEAGSEEETAFIRSWLGSHNERLRQGTSV
ncbi:MAG: hypothetical protein Unbinned2514contig1000_46 [Prokaryotic dsDNA virus sp.]|nr:MAG: hypothetical protein Unbinned2514contig1000_46 [Prokaryotic dsDNA virus sp.]|tara:strand:+ start:13475 stop:13762 length:288 start_codon:yes stop_codon:yes gene_type:complete